MLSVFYQFVKDILSASESDRIGQLSDEQWVVTKAELKRKLDMSVAQIEREFKQQEGEIKVDFAGRGLAASSLPGAHIRQARARADEAIQDKRAEFEYAIRMIELERKKLGVS